MAKNEFLPFGIADGANVLTNEEYGKLATRTNGFSSGVAKSQELNKVWRQASVITSVVAQFIAETNNQDVLDDGNTAALRAGLLNALRATVGSNIPVASQTTAGIAKLSNATNSEAENVAATPKAVKQAADMANQARTEAGNANATANTANQNAANANNNANTRLEKNQNGADIPDPKRFVENLGLAETVERAKNAMSKWQNGADIQNKPAFVNNLGLSELVYRTIGNGPNQIPDMNSFSAGDGHLSFPSGIIIQYGYTPSSTEPKIINFPRPFPAQCFGVTSSGTDPDAANISGCGAIDRFGFYLSAWHVGTETINRTVTINRTATHISWIAIGI